VFSAVLISVKTINTNLVDYREQMNKSTCNYSRSVQLKIRSNTPQQICQHALGLLEGC